MLGIIDSVSRASKGRIKDREDKEQRTKSRYWLVVAGGEHRTMWAGKDYVKAAGRVR